MISAALALMTVVSSATVECERAPVVLLWPVADASSMSETLTEAMPLTNANGTLVYSFQTPSASVYLERSCFGTVADALDFLDGRGCIDIVMVERGKLRQLACETKTRKRMVEQHESYPVWSVTP